MKVVGSTFEMFLWGAMQTHFSVNQENLIKTVKETNHLISLEIVIRAWKHMKKTFTHKTWQEPVRVCGI